MRKDGTILWVRESACAVHDIQGHLIVLLTCDDITCLLYTSDAADERSSVDLGGRRIIKKKNTEDHCTRRTI